MPLQSVMAKPCYSKSVTFFVDLPNQCQDTQHTQQKEKLKKKKTPPVQSYRTLPVGILAILEKGLREFIWGMDFFLNFFLS